jgi:hypothetical protein
VCQGSLFFFTMDDDSDEELLLFLVADELSQPKFLRYGVTLPERKILAINNFSDDQCLNMFRFNRADLFDCCIVFIFPT